MKYSEILEKAKEVLKVERYVCIAVGTVCGVYDTDEDTHLTLAAREIRTDIEDRLGGRHIDGSSPEFGEWLKHKNPEKFEEEFLKDRFLYNLRLEFIDELIAYWKEQGN